MKSGAIRAGSASEVTNPIVSGALSRDALTYVMILAGFWLVVFVAPPNQWWAVIDETDHDWRPTIVALAMIPLNVLILAVPWLRHLFDIRLLPLWNYLIIVAAVIRWALALRFTWKARIFERLFGYQ